MNGLIQTEKGYRMTSFETFEPTCGRLVASFNNSALPEMEDCHIYILNGDKNLSAAVSACLAKIPQNNGFLNRYPVCDKCDASTTETLKPLHDAIAEEHATIVMPYHTPKRFGRYFVVANVKTDDVNSHIPQIVFDSEAITRRCLVDVAKEYARTDTGGFISDLSKDDIDNVLIKMALPCSLGAHIGFGIAPSAQRIREVLNKKNAVTHLDRISYIDEIRDNLRDWLKLCSKDNLTEDEQLELKKMNTKIELITSGLNAMTLRKLLLGYSQSTQVRVFNAFDPRITASQSKMKIVIEKCEPSSLKRNKEQSALKEGNYRIIFKKSKRSTLVHFERRMSKILYLLYLIDRKKNDVVDTLDISKYKTMLTRLFETVYNPIHSTNDKITFQQINEEEDIGGLLASNYHDIRDKVTEACEQLSEIPSPYLLYRETHLFVLGENIVMPDELLNIGK